VANRLRWSPCRAVELHAASNCLGAQFPSIALSLDSDLHLRSSIVESIAKLLGAFSFMSPF
jgi:hypothetical protein